MKPAKVVDQVNGLLYPEYQAERARLREIDRWYRWEHPPVHVPRHAKPEHRMLIELSRTPWLGLVVNVISQSMAVSGYKEPEAKTGINSGIWRVWQANKFDARSTPLHKAALAYGYAFNRVLPGSLSGSDMPVMRGVSPLDMVALYRDPSGDDWPETVMQVFAGQPGDRENLHVYDDAYRYTLTCKAGGQGVEYVTTERHGAGVVPFVRYAGNLDLEGRAVGEVEPFVAIAARINKTDYDRLLTQHFASWKVRYATGMERPADDDEAAKAAMRLAQMDMLIAEAPDARFGTLDASSLDGFLKAHDSDVETLSAVAQVPSDALTGKMINMSAEALASARAQLELKVGERKVAFGESHAQSLRLGAAYLGDEAAARDVLARITWQDLSVRSMAQAVDALGKAAQMLSVPVQALWPMIPGVSQSDVQDWIALALQGDPIESLNRLLDAQADPAPAAAA